MDSTPTLHLCLVFSLNSLLMFSRSDHYGTMTITFTQDSDSTNVEMILTGVPKGKEEEVERGLEGY